MSDEIAEAVAAATSEVGGESTPDTDTTSDVDTSQDVDAGAEEGEVTASDEAEAEASDVDFINPTKADLELIENTPALKRVYMSMRRGLTQKTQEIAAARRASEEHAKFIEWINNDPQTAIRTMAAAAGMTLGEAKKDAGVQIGDQLENRWAKMVGPEVAKEFRELVQQDLQNALNSYIAPLRQQTDQLAQAAAERGIAASVREFGAERAENEEDWDDDIQAEMAELAERMEPGKDVSINDYLDTIYSAVIAKRQREQRAAQGVERLRRARSTSEPTTTTRPSPARDLAITKDMNDNDAIAAAVKMARLDMGMRG